MMSHSLVHFHLTSAVSESEVVPMPGLKWRHKCVTCRHGRRTKKKIWSVLCKKKQELQKKRKNATFYFGTRSLTESTLRFQWNHRLCVFTQPMCINNRAFSEKRPLSHSAGWFLMQQQQQFDDSGQGRKNSAVREASGRRESFGSIIANLYQLMYALESLWPRARRLQSAHARVHSTADWLRRSKSQHPSTVSVTTLQ